MTSGGSWKISGAAVDSSWKTTIGGGSNKRFGAGGSNLFCSGSTNIGASVKATGVVVVGGAVATVDGSVNGARTGLGVGGFVLTVSGACVVVLRVVMTSIGDWNVTGVCCLGSACSLGWNCSLGGAVLKVGGKVLSVGRVEVARSVVGFALDDVIHVDGILDVKRSCGIGGRGLTAFCSSNQFSKFRVYSPVASKRSAKAVYIVGC